MQRESGHQEVPAPLSGRKRQSGKQASSRVSAGMKGRHASKELPTNFENGLYHWSKGQFLRLLRRHRPSGPGVVPEGGQLVADWNQTPKSFPRSNLITAVPVNGETRAISVWVCLPYFMTNK